MASFSNQPPRNSDNVSPISFESPIQMHRSYKKTPGQIFTQERELDTIPLADQRLLQDEKPFRRTEEVKWGVAWGVPFMIVSWTVTAMILSLGHHFYYQSLHGTPAGTSKRQNWALIIGTGFSFLAVALFRTACNIAYKQYIWTLLKRKSFHITAVDKLFQLPTDLFAFHGWELWRHGELAVPLAIVCWTMAFAAITPPATLSVGRGYLNDTSTVPMPSINWASKSITDVIDYVGFPSYDTLQLASKAAFSMSVIPSGSPPGSNVTFHRQFYGPSVQCALPNATDDAFFKKYKDSLWDNSQTIPTRADFETQDYKWNYWRQLKNNTWISKGVNYTEGERTNRPTDWYPLMNIFSAVSPFSGEQYWANTTYDSDTNPGEIDEYGNWWPQIPLKYSVWLNSQYSYGFNSSDVNKNGSRWVVQKLFVQSSSEALVCTLGNASFDVDFQYIDGVQTLAAYSISDWKPFWVPLYARFLMGTRDKITNKLLDPEHFRGFQSYMGIYTAFTSLLNGNVTTTLSATRRYDTDSQEWSFDGNVSVAEGTSKVLQHGLSACEGVRGNVWSGDNAIGIGLEGPARWQESLNTTSVDPTNISYTYFPAVKNDLFNKPAWMCRNTTLMKGIEDLANNITISLLSSPSYLTSNNDTLTQVHAWHSQNIYIYTPRNLIISYSIATLLTLLSLLLCFYSFYYNGVAHSTNFSAIVGTTRNPELDAYFKGHSLGVFGGARGQSIEAENGDRGDRTGKRVRIRFGELVHGPGRRERMGVGGDRGMGGGMGDGMGMGGRESMGSLSSAKMDYLGGLAGEGSTARHIGFGAVENVVAMRKGGRYV